MDKTITLNLSANDLNVLLTALGQLPYYQVAQLINHIQAEAGPQLVSEKRQSADKSPAQDNNLKSING